MSYLQDPDAIYRASFAAIRAEVDLGRFPEAFHDMVLRLVHAGAMPDIADDLAWRGDPVTAAKAALAAGKPVIADAKMTAVGILVNRLPEGCEVICTLGDPRVSAMAKEAKTTRSAAAVELWRPHLEGAVVAIGNAPTALFKLLEMLAEPDCPKPAALLAFPLGFIGAAESKAALVASGIDVPFVTLTGRRGGSAYAAAAVNSLLVPSK